MSGDREVTIGYALVFAAIVLAVGIGFGLFFGDVMDWFRRGRGR